MAHYLLRNLINNNPPSLSFSLWTPGSSCKFQSNRVRHWWWLRRGQIRMWFRVRTLRPGHHQMWSEARLGPWLALLRNECCLQEARQPVLNDTRGTSGIRQRRQAWEPKSRWTRVFRDAEGTLALVAGRSTYAAGCPCSQNHDPRLLWISTDRGLGDQSGKQQHGFAKESTLCVVPRDCWGGIYKGVHLRSTPDRTIRGHSIGGRGRQFESLRGRSLYKWRIFSGSLRLTGAQCRHSPVDILEKLLRIPRDSWRELWVGQKDLQIPWRRPSSQFPGSCAGFYSVWAGA